MVYTKPPTNFPMVYFCPDSLGNMYIAYNKPVPFGHAYENYYLRNCLTGYKM